MDINKYYTEVLLEFKTKLNLKPKSKIVLVCLSPDITMLKYKKIAYYFWVEYANDEGSVASSFEFDFDYVKANKNLCRLFIFKLAAELRNVSPDYLTFYNWSLSNDHPLRTTLKDILI